MTFGKVRRAARTIQCESFIQGLQLENGSGFEHQIASHDMGVKPVFSVAVFPDRIPEPALGIAELGAANVSKPDGEIDVGVIFRTSHLNRQIAPGKLKVLVSRNALYREVAAAHPRIEVCRSGN